MEILTRSFIFIFLFPLLLIIACEDGTEPDIISYQAHIQNIFDISCLTACHDGTREAGLELSSRQTLMSGGDRLVVEPGNAEESPLVWSIEGQDNSGIPVSIMPPVNSGFPQLTSTEIRLIKDWIDQGAQDN